MSDSHEPSYYEIALTNRQVLTVFVILLVCLVAAFFAGVWVSREGLLRPAEALQAEAEPEAAEAGGSVGELNFFSESGDRGRPAAQRSARREKKAPLARVVEEGRAGTTLAEDVGGAPSADSGASGAQPAAGAPAGPPDAPRQPAPGTAAADAPKLPAPARAGTLVIQVFSSHDREQADRLRQRLVGGGYPAFLLSEEVRGKTMYRVRIGPYAERSEAERVATQVRSEHKLETWITQ